MQVPRGSHHGLKRHVAAEVRDHSRPRPRPVVLEDSVDQEAGPEHQRHDEEQRRPRRHDRRPLRPEQLDEKHGDRRRDGEHRHHRFQLAEDLDGAEEARHVSCTATRWKNPATARSMPGATAKTSPVSTARPTQDEADGAGRECCARVLSEWHAASLVAVAFYSSQLLSLPGLTGQSSNPCASVGLRPCPDRSLVVTGSPGQAGR